MRYSRDENLDKTIPGLGHYAGRVFCTEDQYNKMLLYFNLVNVFWGGWSWDEKDLDFGIPVYTEEEPVVLEFINIMEQE